MYMKCRKIRKEHKIALIGWISEILNFFVLWVYRWFC